MNGHSYVSYPRDVALNNRAALNKNITPSVETIEAEFTSVSYLVIVPKGGKLQDASTIKFTAVAFQKMTLGQYEAIKTSITDPNVWNDKQYDVTIFYDALGGTLMVTGLPIVIGIEPDGYTHS